MKKEIKIRRMKQLRKLGEKLLKVPQENFNMAHWTFTRDPSGCSVPTQLVAPKNIKTLTCGFSACAIGWFPTLVPAAKKEGFNIQLVNGRAGLFPIPAYKRNRAWNAIESYFGLTPDDAEYLFMDDSYGEYDLGKKVTNESVSRRLIEFANKALEDLRSV